MYILPSFDKFVYFVGLCTGYVVPVGKVPYAKELTVKQTAQSKCNFMLHSLF